MKKINVEQRSLAWHNMRATRIGASEAWGIVQHYATDAELLAAGIDPLEARSEINKAYTSAYALYQRIKGNPYPQTIDFWDSQFGEAVEYWVRSKYTTAPKAEVYADKFNICSLDLADATDGWWCAPIVEVKSRREIAADFKWSWQLQVSLQCRAKGVTNAGILQIALENFDEALRVCVGFAYQKMTRKKFIKYFDGLNKEIDFRRCERNDRLLALYDVCAARFWADVESNKSPVPVLADEPNASAVNVLLGSFVGESTCDLSRYIKLKRLERTITTAVKAEKQKIFVRCVADRANRVADTKGNSAKWSTNGALLAKEWKGK